MLLQVGEGKMCIMKKKNTFTWNAQTHTHNGNGNLFGAHALYIHFCYLLLCVCMELT